MTESLHRPLTMEEVLVHVPLTCEDQEFRGPDAEGDAEAWLRRHVLSALAWEWIIVVTVELEGGAVVTVEHPLAPGRMHGSVRNAVVHHLVNVSREEAASPETRTHSHVLAERINGSPLPVPVMREEWDLWTRKTVLVPAPHQYHSHDPPIQTSADTHRPVHRIAEQE